MQGTFNLILKTPRLIDFDNKRNFFRSKIRQQHEQVHHHHNLRVAVRRAYVLEDSYNQVRSRGLESNRPVLGSGICRSWWKRQSALVDCFFPHLSEADANKQSV
jgi:hypothetical protein